MSASVILLSGGLDSSTALALKKREEDGGVALGFDYGQRHRRELEAATKIAAHYQVPFHVEEITLTADPDESLMDGKATRLQGEPTVVQGRNLLLIAHALRFALLTGCDRLVIGCNQTDRQTYPDCRSEFLQSLSLALQLAYGVRLEAPLIEKDKRQIVEMALAFGVPVEDTYSCYRGEEEPCGVCGACWERQQGLLNARLAEERPDHLARRAAELVKLEALR